MRILIINQYYYPDIAATAQLCADLAEDLVRRGHQVTVVAGTAAYRIAHDGGQPLPSVHLRLRDEHRGVRIVRVPMPPLGGEGLAGRALGFVAFLAGALVRVLTEERPDVVMALSTPPLVAALGLVLQALRGCRLVYWVQDVYPDLAIRLGVMRSDGAAARLLAALSQQICQRADLIVALDVAMAARLRSHGAPPERIHVVDNWCDATEVVPQAPEDNPLRRSLGLGATFTVGYAGNLGRGHDFTTVLSALLRLDQEPIEWLFIGDGPQRAWVQEQARGLSRVHFLPPQARCRLRDVLTAGDVGLVTLEAGLDGLLVPSKLYGLLAAGRPVLYVGPPAGRVAELLREEEIGESVRNGDVAGLIAAVRRLGANPTLRARMGQRARALFEQAFTRELATARHAALLERILDHREGGP
ncbi:MAG: glycosyltransferase family 4 protein [Myxococcales bacterium]|nr:glycosyltransferase family 4 protein [Myxococcota bacterium]MDW8280168.1 glycosyltransferase family 4 protein [Myxococcales bacterium]